MLTDEQRRAFDRDGYLCLPDFVPRAACDALVARAEALVDAFEPAAVSVFTTREQDRRSDAYFLDSGDKVRFFFEQDAFGPGGALRVPKARAINKIGHALPDLDPCFAGFSRRAEHARLARDRRGSGCGPGVAACNHV